MKTHYVRRLAHKNNHLTSAVESLIYRLTPEDRMVTADELYELVKSRHRAEEVPLPPRKTFDTLLASMAERHFLFEIVGVRIERLLTNL